MRVLTRRETFQRWPEDRTQRLLLLFAQGKDDDAIAKLLGMTRSAIIGKRQRLKLYRRDPTGIRTDDPYVLAIARAKREREATP